MTINQMNPKVDEFLHNAKKWREEYEKLRTFILDCELVEDFKWMHPCYTFEKKNIVLIHGFKEYCALQFHKGALLQDTHGILVQQTENTQSARQIRFTNIQEIIEMETILKKYINEAIEVEKNGLKLEVKERKEIGIPEELQTKFDEMPTFKNAFESLTPGRQRAYILYFSQAKQSKTRVSRIEKYIEKILDGKGLNDCTCGLSQKGTNCDGSHKALNK
ncbi:YdeI/OmpD-associated family protein [Bacillus thuringiensis]|nr:YdeI/OmpD-associated family protein [Bacillus thuringiensis]